MTHPRLAAVLSAIAASTVVFLVVSRWRLAGTITGAVLIPLVYTLVSHWSSQSLDHMGTWVRRRTSRGEGVTGPARIPAEEALLSPASGGEGKPPGGSVVTQDQGSRFGTKRTQWLLIGLASFALAVSIYALSSRGPVERVIVHDRVVEKTITLTTPAQTSGAQGSGTSDPTETTLVAAENGAASTTVTATETGQPSSTTITTATTTTSLPQAPTTTEPSTATTSSP